MGMLGYSISSYDREEPRNKEAEREQLVEDTREQIEKAMDMIYDALNDWDYEEKTNLLDRWGDGEDISELLDEIY